MRGPSDAEWSVLMSLLPKGWQEAAREHRAFERARYTPDPASLLRLLLFRAVNDGGLRDTAAQARAAGIASMSPVALLKRVRRSGDWLAWLGGELCRPLREEPRVAHGFRLRVVDGTTVQGPAATTTGWRLHFVLDLRSLSCDWYELTDRFVGESLARVPVHAGDVLLADRNYLRPDGVRTVVDAGGHLVVRVRWTHPKMHDPHGVVFRVLEHATALRVGEVGSWPVEVLVPGKSSVSGRVIATRLPAPLAERAVRKATRSSAKKGTRADPRSLQAAQLVMVFTTLPEAQLDDRGVLELYRYRWQIELTFKRLKQLLKIGRLPHKDPLCAKGWILAKLVVALLLETLSRNAATLSPWGFHIASATPQPR